MLTRFYIEFPVCDWSKLNNKTKRQRIRWVNLKKHVENCLANQAFLFRFSSLSSWWDME